MSAEPKGVLVGTTAEKLRDEVSAYPHERGNLHYTVAVALAAQRAMAVELKRTTSVDDEDEEWFWKTFWDACVKLGVK